MTPTDAKGMLAAVKGVLSLISYEHIVSAAVGALIALFLRHLYETWREKPRPEVKQVLGFWTEREGGYPPHPQYEIRAQVDVLNRGGGVSLVRPVLRYVIGNRNPIVEVGHFLWMERRRPDVETPFGKLPAYEHFTTIFLPRNELTTFTLLGSLSRSQLDDEAKDCLDNERGQWQLICPLSRGRPLSARVNVVLKGKID